MRQPVKEYSAEMAFLHSNDSDIVYLILRVDQSTVPKGKSDSSKDTEKPTGFSDRLYGLDSGDYDLPSRQIAAR